MDSATTIHIPESRDRSSESADVRRDHAQAASATASSTARSAEGTASITRGLRGAAASKKRTHNRTQQTAATAP